MDYTSDSDVSENTRELVSQGLASVNRKRLNIASQSDSVRERPLVSNMDISSVRHHLRRRESNGDTSTHGLTQHIEKLLTARITT